MEGYTSDKYDSTIILIQRQVFTLLTVPMTPSWLLEHWQVSILAHVGWCRCWGYSRCSSDITSEDQVCHESAWGLDEDLEISERFVGGPVSCLPNCTEHNNFTLISHKSQVLYKCLLTCSHVPCTFLAAEEASPELPYPCSYRGKQLVDRESGVFLIFTLESRLLCVSGCRRFHDNLSGYCPHHQWSRWAKCIDWVSTAPRLGSQLCGNADPMLTQHRSQKVHERFPTPTWRYEVLFRGHWVSTWPELIFQRLQLTSLRLGTWVSSYCFSWLKLPWSWRAVGSWLCCCCRCSWAEMAPAGYAMKCRMWGPSMSQSHAFVNEQNAEEGFLPRIEL